MFINNAATSILSILLTQSVVRVRPKTPTVGAVSARLVLSFRGLFYLFFKIYNCKYRYNKIYNINQRIENALPQ